MGAGQIGKAVQVPRGGAWDLRLGGREKLRPRQVAGSHPTIGCYEPKPSREQLRGTQEASASVQLTHRSAQVERQAPHQILSPRIADVAGIGNTHGSKSQPSPFLCQEVPLASGRASSFTRGCREQPSLSRSERRSGGSNQQGWLRLEPASHLSEGLGAPEEIALSFRAAGLSNLFQLGIALNALCRSSHAELRREARH